MIYSNLGGFIVAYSRRGVDMRARVRTHVEATETLRSMKEDEIVDLNKVRYYFSSDKILILHKPNIKNKTYDTIYGMREKHRNA